jgi:DNA repair protein RadC
MPASFSLCVFDDLRNLAFERLDIAYLDAQRNILSISRFTNNSPDRAAPSLRTLIAEGLSHDAAALIIAHNHPSGVAKPSPQDCAFTRTLGQLAGGLDMPLLDHLILAGEARFSFREAGLL